MKIKSKIIMEFKGTKGKWFIDHEESGYNEHHQLCTPISVNGIIGFCDVYGDDEESKANAKLIASAPEMFEDIKESITSLKILRNQIAFESKKSTQWIGMAEAIDKWIEQKQQLLTKITE